MSFFDRSRISSKVNPVKDMTLRWYFSLHRRATAMASSRLQKGSPPERVIPEVFFAFFAIMVSNWSNVISVPDSKGQVVGFWQNGQ